MDGAAAGTQVLSAHPSSGSRRRRATATWDDRREALGDAVLRTLETVAPGLGARVQTRQVLTPLDLERDYGLTGGHPLHVEPGARLVLRLAAAPGLGALSDAARRASTSPVPGRTRAVA